MANISPWTHQHQQRAPCARWECLPHQFVLHGHTSGRASGSRGNLVILRAREISAPKFPRQKHTSAQRAGLLYQRQVTSALRTLAPKHVDIKPTPWFSYCDETHGENNWAICSPDVLLIDQQFEYIIVIEIKTTFTPLAFQKLFDLYCPVVSKALVWPSRPLVICKRLGLSDPLPRLTLLSALGSKEPLITWLGQGPIKW